MSRPMPVTAPRAILTQSVGEHESDPDDVHPASAITFAPAGTISSTNVQDAIEEVAAEAGVTDHGALTGLADNDHPQYTTDAEAGVIADASVAVHTGDTTAAHAASAVSVLDTGGNFTGTDVEAVLAELAGGGGPDTDLVTVAASGASETIDVSVARTYDVTLTSNCTITLTGAVDEEAWYLTILFRQDGTGGRIVTWPGSVTWVDTEPVLSTTPGDVDIITLLSVDGGAQWAGTAGESVAALVASLDDLTDVNAPTPSDGDVLVYDGGTSQWVPSTPLSSAASISALGFVGQILIADTHSTPLVFADLIQTEAQDDLVYADL